MQRFLPSSSWGEGPCSEEQRYWVIGGDYSDRRFDEIEPETETVHGPYNDELKARIAWQRLTFRDHCRATTRYSLCVEPSRR